MSTSRSARGPPARIFGSATKFLLRIVLLAGCVALHHLHGTSAGSPLRGGAGPLPEGGGSNRLTRRVVRSLMSQFRMARRAGLPSRRSLLAFPAAGPLAAGLPACSFPVRLAAVPRGQASAATVLGLPNERFFVTEAAGQAALQQEFVAAVQRQLVARGLPPTVPILELDLLGVSGGGENGAFSAGLLNGWTERGDRPAFFLVTGISTGALTAPFAFLGSSQDAKLKSVYTDITLADVIVQRGLTAAIWDDALADNTPLFRTISRYLDEAMLAEIAHAYEGGRLLLIA